MTVVILLLLSVLAVYTLTSRDLLHGVLALSAFSRR